MLEAGRGARRTGRFLFVQAGHEAPDGCFPGRSAGALHKGLLPVPDTNGRPCQPPFLDFQYSVQGVYSCVQIGQVPPDPELSLRTAGGRGEGSSFPMFFPLPCLATPEAIACLPARDRRECFRNGAKRRFALCEFPVLPPWPERTCHLFSRRIPCSPVVNCSKVFAQPEPWCWVPCASRPRPSPPGMDVPVPIAGRLRPTSPRSPNRRDRTSPNRASPNRRDRTSPRRASPNRQDRTSPRRASPNRRDPVVPVLTTGRRASPR